PRWWGRRRRRGPGSVSPGRCIPRPRGPGRRPSPRRRRGPPPRPAGPAGGRRNRCRSGPARRPGRGRRPSPSRPLRPSPSGRPARVARCASRPLSPVLRQPAPDAHDGTGGAQYGEQRRARRQAGQRVPACPGGLVELGPLVGEGGGQVPVDLVEALAGRALATDDQVQGLLVIAVLVLLAGGAVTLLPLPHAGEGGRDGPGAVVVVREALGVREALAEGVDLPAEVVVVGVDGGVADLAGLGAAGHQREVLVAAG